MEVGEVFGTSFCGVLLYQRLTYLPETMVSRRGELVYTEHDLFHPIQHSHRHRVTISLRLPVGVEELLQHMLPPPVRAFVVIFLPFRGSVVEAQEELAVDGLGD